MWNALFAFDDPTIADDVATQLRAGGFPAGGVCPHRRASGPPGGAPQRVDEQVTGGALAGLLDLFQGVFDWGESPHDAAPFEAVVNRGGVVLELRAVDARQRRQADLVAEPFAQRRTVWRQAP
ncbi:MAG: hypothetical protein U1F53_22725 [Burkholderiaceae bacterium]